MWATLITSMIPVAVRLIGMWLDKGLQDKEAQKAWEAFLKTIAGNPGSSPRLKAQYEDQLKSKGE
jgi:hypothetical protein